MGSYQVADDTRLRRLFGVPAVDSFDVSPSGMVVFSSDPEGQFQLYLKEGGEKISKLTTDPEMKTFPFFLDEKRLIFFADTNGDENYDIFLMSSEAGNSFRQGSAVNLTPGTDFSIQPFVTYSADRSKAVVVANRDGDFATYLLAGVNGEMRRMTHHSFSDERADISPDGKRIAVTSLVSGQEYAIFVMEEESGRTDALSDPESGKIIEASFPSWSSDGRMLAFASTEKGFSDIGIVDIDTGKLRWLTDGGKEYANPVLSPDGRMIAYTVNERDRIGLVLRSMTGAFTEIDVSPSAGFVHALKFSEDSKHLYFTFSGKNVPFDVFCHTIEGAHLAQATRSLPAEIDTSSFVEAKMVRFRSRADGLPLSALLYLPAGWDGDTTLPAVVDIHGGPAWQSLNRWNPFTQMLVSSGAAVIAPNYRGSTGYGKEFREANRHVMGVADLDDCVSAADYLIEHNIADSGKIAVTGASFGGYLTMCALTRYPDRWACGSAVVPFLNWFTEMENEREDLRFWDMQNMGDPAKDRERLKNASPFFYLDRVIAPVQIIAGANDPRCPLEESIRAKEEMEKLGKKVDFHYYPDEGHGFSKRENRVDADMRVFRFLETHLFDRSE